LVVHQSQESLLNENRDILRAVTSRIISRIQAETDIKNVSSQIQLLLRQWSKNPLDFSLKFEEALTQEEIRTTPAVFRPEAPVSQKKIQEGVRTTPAVYRPEAPVSKKVDFVRKPAEFFKEQKQKELESLKNIEKKLRVVTLYGEKIDSTILTLLKISELEEPISVRHLARSTMQNELLLRAWLQKLDRAGLIDLTGDLIKPAAV
ncbi:MAG: hypothetical protein ACFFBD_15860, partial [Candidatus Hodarchaeota archaeon]